MIRDDERCRVKSIGEDRIAYLVRRNGDEYSVLHIVMLVMLYPPAVMQMPVFWFPPFSFSLCVYGVYMYMTGFTFAMFATAI